MSAQLELRGLLLCPIWQPMGYMQLFNFVKQIKFKIQFLSYTSHISSTQQPHVTTVPEGTEYRTFPSSYSSTGEYCFQSFSSQSNKEKRKIFNIKLWQNMKNRWYRDTFNLYKDFRQEKETQKKTHRIFRFQSPDISIRLGRSLICKVQSQQKREPKEKLLSMGTSFPFKKSQNIQTPEAQCYKGLRTENVQMELRCNFFKERRKKEAHLCAW